MSKNKTSNFRSGPPGGSIGRPVEKAKNFKQTFQVFQSYLKPYYLQLLIISLLAIISTVFAIISPKLLGQMTDIIAAGLFNRTAIDFSAIATIGYWLIGLYLISALFNYLQSWLMTNISQQITYDFRKKISEKISRLPLRYFDKHQTGDLISRVTNDVETVSQNLNQSLVQVVASTVTVLGILVMMLTISWQLTLIALTILPISLLFIGLVTKKSQRYYTQQQATLGDINGHIEEMFSNHNIVKVFNGEQRSIKKFTRLNNELYDSGWKSQFLSGLMMPIMHFISNIGYVAIAVVGGWLAINNRLSIGSIQAFIQYMNQFTQPISQAANLTNIFQSTAAAAERVFEFLAGVEELADLDTINLPSTISGQVSFNHVCFSYDADKPVIKDFTAEVKPHCNVAIVGPTGAGKTTIVNLLMRFYELDSGTITIDGLNIKNLKRPELRQLFGMVLQDTWLFNGTIAENIAFGKPDASLEQIVKAAEDAHIDHLIRTLPSGYDTIITDSLDSLSAGEKQLLTIARALLADAPMLILDEATSSVDTRTESLIQSAMDKLTHGRTSFVIAHRLSTIKNADLILVMRDGNIVEQGRHNDLLSQNGFYADLYNSQFAESEA